MPGSVDCGEPMTAASDPFFFSDDPSFYRTLVDHALDVINVVDAGGLILFSSPSARAVLGYEPSELVGRSIFEFVHPDDIERTREAFELAVLCEEPTAPIVYRCLHRSGEWLNVESIGRYRSDLASQGFGIINSRDITERTRLEERFRRAQGLDAIGRMTAALVHDFHNFLMTIVGNSDLILRSNPKASVEESALHIRKAADDATALTRQLLMLARHGMTSTAHDAGDADVNVTAADMARIFARVVDERTELVCALDATRPLAAIERSRLEQVLINLVVNARDAMPNGGTITVTTRDVEAGASDVPGLTGAHVVVEVSDNGVGMSPEVRAKVFEPFFSTKPVGKGTGLGLSTVAEIVGRAGGSVDVETSAGHGSTFRIRLPHGRRGGLLNLGARS